MNMRELTVWSHNQKCSRRIDEVIVHCSATKEGKEFHVEDIRRWHLAQGWKDCGYHYVITLDGTIEIGRPLDEVGAHCTSHNAHSIGICYIGGLSSERKPKDTRTPEQRNALNVLISHIVQRWPSVRVVGHSKYAAKACPCFDAEAEYKDAGRRRT